MTQLKQSIAPHFRYFWSSRFWLAGPVTLIVAVFVMAAMSLWLPQGLAGIDHLLVPLVLFPLIWTVIFFYVILENNIKRAWLVMMLIFAINALPVVASILGWLK